MARRVAALLVFFAACGGRPAPPAAKPAVPASTAPASPATTPAAAPATATEPFPDGWYAVAEHLSPDIEGQADEAPLKDETLLLQSRGWIRVRGKRAIHASGLTFKFDRKAGRWETVGSPSQRCTLYVTPTKNVILTAASDSSRYETFVLRPLTAEEQPRAEAALREAEDLATPRDAGIGSKGDAGARAR